MTLIVQTLSCSSFLGSTGGHGTITDDGADSLATTGDGKFVHWAPETPGPGAVYDAYVDALIDTSGIPSGGTFQDVALVTKQPGNAGGGTGGLLELYDSGMVLVESWTLSSTETVKSVTTPDEAQLRGGVTLRWYFALTGSYVASTSLVDELSVGLLWDITAGLPRGRQFPRDDIGRQYPHPRSVQSQGRVGWSGHYY